MPKPKSPGKKKSKQDKLKQKVKIKLERKVARLQRCYKDFYYLPLTYEHLKGILLSYLFNIKPYFPMYQNEIMIELRNYLQDCSYNKNIQKMPQFNLIPVLKQLSDNSAFKITKRAIGSTMAIFIQNPNRQKIQVLYNQFKEKIPSKLSASQLYTVNSKIDYQQRDLNYINFDPFIKKQKEIQDKVDNSKGLSLIITDMLIKGPVFWKQWICCDIRKLDMRVLGYFQVVMADPPWDIHMTLPYTTMKDKQMKNLGVQVLQKDGLIFLWVTGRAMQLGRDCLQKWGYRRVEEIIWVKTQSNAIIRSGRTGHWLNHTKQHCLVGIKGQPKFNKNIDCDVITSKVRQTSRKPDQIYRIIQRLAPGGRYIQLFGRPHNTRENWLTIGNQLPGTYIQDPKLLQSYKKAYPYQNLSKQKMQYYKELLLSGKQDQQVYNGHIQKKSE